MARLFLFMVIDASQACQRSPIDIQDIQGVNGDMPNMHVSYGSWNRSELGTSDGHTMVFSWQYPLDGGSIRVGSSFATAATCVLKRISVWPRLHLTQDHDVAAEVHFEHNCLSGNMTTKQARNRAMLAELYSASVANVSAAQEDLAAARTTQRWCAVAESTCGGCREARQNLSAVEESVNALVQHLEEMHAVCRLLAAGPGVKATAPENCTYKAALGRIGSSANAKGCKAQELATWPSLSTWHSQTGGYQQAIEKHKELIKSLQSQQEEVDEYAVIESSYHKEVKMDRAILVKQVTRSNESQGQHPIVHFVLHDNVSISGLEAIFGTDTAETAPGQHYTGTHLHGSRHERRA